MAKPIPQLLSLSVIDLLYAPIEAQFSTLLISSEFVANKSKELQQQCFPTLSSKHNELKTQQWHGFGKISCLSLKKMKPIFCGNLDFESRQSDIERLFRRYGKVDRVDIKSGFAFVYMEDERDAEYAIRRLDRTEFGRKGRQLRVEWTKQERGMKRPSDSKRSSANTKPSKTLFVINFDPINTRTRDLERHFDSYGKILNIRIRRNFAFVQFESQEDATKALDSTNMSKFLDRVISVEYAVRDDDDRRNGYSPDRRGRDMSPDKRSHDRGRSPSPYRRDRGSPDYGRGSNPSSRPDPRASPNYSRDASPVSDGYQSRSPPLQERSRS
ncbi:hypothetical protein FNV43_RR15183 [Rhamnella rubrinervis]|uniref:RRM domain-containing protein n=1 Tax=Rhamnella rubrinervis TaxID=2594499 RepID=A0A8K0E8I0_9ROSA|nr:hypothetical protein FNV43_RR15183 [Rhamnella rubrinervis]